MGARLRPMQNRSKVRLGLKVIHRHRAGQSTFRRVSELVFVGGRPQAVLGWIDTGGVRTPSYVCELDPAKRRKAPATKNTYDYDESTGDPRYEPAQPADLAQDIGRQERKPAGTKAGGEGRNRTSDTRIVSPLLYQLSYLACCGATAGRRGL